LHQGATLEPAEKLNRAGWGTALELAEKLVVLKGHGFIRAVKRAESVDGFSR
jgi:hypothetical protein